MREINCAQLSPGAREVFDKIKKFFPPDSQGKPRWKNVGRVFANNLLTWPRWYDLRKSRDIASLMEDVHKLANQMISDRVTVYRAKNGTLKGFGRQRLSKAIENRLELYWLCIDLTGQIYAVDNKVGLN